MKKFLVPIALFTLLFSSCKTSQISSYSDDIYTSPTEEKRLAKIAEAEKAKKDAEQKQKDEEAALAQKAKDDANPYYQDPQYNSDDYYDYKYASQMRRFNNSNLNMGIGYYDNYYTNAYMYNQNPYSYGSSIYSSYNYWMPSNQFNNYSSGLSLVFSTGNYYGNNGYGYGYGGGYGGGYYGCNNPYWGNPYYSSYNPYFNPYYGYGYNPYYAGYLNGYNNGFYSGSNWGYYNSYDVNSSYSQAAYGARGSNGGGNGGRVTNPGMSIPDGMSERSKFVNAVAIKQETTPKFTEIPRNNTISKGNGQNFENNGVINSNNGSPRNPKSVVSENTVDNGTSTIGSTPRGNGNNNNIETNTTNTQPVKSNPRSNGGFWPSFGNSGNVSNPNSNPVKGSNTNSNPGRGNATYENNGNINPGTTTNPTKGEVKYENNSTIESPGRGSNLGNSNSTPNTGGSNSNSNSGGSSTPRGGSGGGGNRPR